MEGGCRTKRSPRLVCKPSPHPEPLILRVTVLLLLVTLLFCAVTPRVTVLPLAFHLYQAAA